MSFIDNITMHDGLTSSVTQQESTTPEARHGLSCFAFMEKPKVTPNENSVSLKIQVPYTDHGHVIGKSGYTINRVMQETNCHIHFPDSNKTSPLEKSNQVTIVGKCVGDAEMARLQIKSLLPLTFSFVAPEGFPDFLTTTMRGIQHEFRVKLFFRSCGQFSDSCMVYVKGSQADGGLVKRATMVVIHHFYGNNAPTVPVFMSMDIKPQHHAAVRGPGDINVEKIMTQTNTEIKVADVLEANPSQGSLFAIKGHDLNGVHQAWLMLQSYIPVSLWFDLPEDRLLDSSILISIERQQGVKIFQRLKPFQPSNTRTVVIKALDHQVIKMYQTRILVIRSAKLVPVEGEEHSREDCPLWETWNKCMDGLHDGKLISNCCNLELGLDITRERSLSASSDGMWPLLSCKQSVNDGFNYRNSSSDDAVFNEDFSSTQNEVIYNDETLPEITLNQCSIHQESGPEAKGLHDAELRHSAAFHGQKPSIAISPKQPHTTSSPYNGAVTQRQRVLSASGGFRNHVDPISESLTRTFDRATVEDSYSQSMIGGRKRSLHVDPCSQSLPHVFCLKSYCAPTKDTDIYKTLVSMDLEKYMAVFEMNEITYDVFVQMTPAELKSIGLPFGPVKKLAGLIEKIRIAAASGRE